jgi:hypothetical protein
MIFSASATCIFEQVGEVCIMNPVQQPVSGAIGSVSPAHLMITDRDVKLLATDPERFMEEMQSRATKIGPVLEAILRESHGQPRWGLNE